MTKYIKELSKRQFIWHKGKSSSSLFKTRTCHWSCKKLMIYRSAYKRSSIAPKTANLQSLHSHERKNSLLLFALEPLAGTFPFSLKNPPIYIKVHHIFVANILEWNLNRKLKIETSLNTLLRIWNFWTLILQTLWSGAVLLGHMYPWQFNSLQIYLCVTE